MKGERLIARWRSRGVILQGHFVFASGRHGSEYIDKKALRAYFDEWDELCLQIAKRFAGQNIEVIIGPSQGGIAVALLVALHLKTRYGEKVLVLNADQDKRGDLYLNPTDKRLLRDKRVLIVDDIFTTGSSTQKIIILIKEYAEEIVGLGIVCNRGGDAIKKIGLPAYAVVNIELDSLSREECKDSGLCAQGIPINTNYGHGQQ